MFIQTNKSGFIDPPVTHTKELQMCTLAAHKLWFVPTLSHIITAPASSCKCLSKIQTTITNCATQFSGGWEIILRPLTWGPSRINKHCALIAQLPTLPLIRSKRITLQGCCLIHFPFDATTTIDKEVHLHSFLNHMLLCWPGHILLHLCKASPHRWPSSSVLCLQTVAQFLTAVKRSSHFAATQLWFIYSPNATVSINHHLLKWFSSKADKRIYPPCGFWTHTSATLTVIMHPAPNAYCIINHRLHTSWQCWRGTKSTVASQPRSIPDRCWWLLNQLWLPAGSRRCVYMWLCVLVCVWHFGWYTVHGYFKRALISFCDEIASYSPSFHPVWKVPPCPSSRKCFSFPPSGCHIHSQTWSDLYLRGSVGCGHLGQDSHLGAALFIILRCLWCSSPVAGGAVMRGFSSLERLSPSSETDEMMVRRQ